MLIENLSFMDIMQINLMTFVKKNYAILILTLCIIISIIFHFYLLPSHLHFAGDEATMSQAIKQIVVDHRFPSVGPSASLGNNIYHGAFFYYLFLIPGILTSFNPLGFAIFTAWLSILAIIPLYIAIYKVYGTNVALFTSFIYAISFNINFYGRWEWNPNTIPVFTILTLFAFVMILENKKYYLLLATFSIAAITQLHITGYVVFPLLIYILIVTRRKIMDLKIYILSACTFFIPIAPTIIHEFKHKFEMLRAILYILLHPTTHISLWSHIQHGWSTMLFIFYEIVQIDQSILYVCIVIGLGILCTSLFQQKNKNASYTSGFFLIILLLSFLMYAFYPSVVFLHYGEHLFPIFVILLGLTLDSFFRYKETLVAGGLLLLMLIYNNLASFNENVINGEKSFYFNKIICNTIKKNGDIRVSLIVNGELNPKPVSYICENEYNIIIASDGTKTYSVHTDYKNIFEISLSKVN